MEAHASRGIEAIRSTRKARLLAGASCAALAIACWLPAEASAADYPAGSDADLRFRINQANGDGDPSSTITLTASFATDPSSLPVPTKPITIDTGSFTLSGTAGTGATSGDTIGSTRR